MEDLLQQLTEGKPKGKGRADDVAAQILQQGPELLHDLWPGLFSSSPLLRARTAHVLESVAKNQPNWLQPFQQELLYQLAQPELDPAFYFHIPSILGLLKWPENEVALVVERLEFWLQHIDHQFLKVFCLQALTDIAVQQPWLSHEVEELVHQHMAKGRKAMNARGRMLLKTLRKIEATPKIYLPS